jgi:hypothetical protein
MSSFICSDRHFNCMEAALVRLTDRNGLYSIRAWEKERVRGFVNVLFDLNHECVCAQYGDNREVYQRSRTPVKEINQFELLKAINCLRYQCEIEGLENFRELTDVETKAWDLLEDIRMELMQRIINNNSSYEKADWEIR